MKKQIIIINGNIGAGKDTVGKLLSEALVYDFVVAGKFFREEAENRGLKLEDFQKILKEDKDFVFDKIIDQKLFDYIDNNDKLVIIHRVAAKFKTNTFKVSLRIDEKVAAERILCDLKVNRDRLSESHVNTLEEVVANNKARIESESYRYKTLYNFDMNDLSYYDRVYDTVNITPEDLASQILKDYHYWLLH